MLGIFCCIDRLIPQPLLDVLVIPVDHNLIGWMLIGGAAEVCCSHPRPPFSLPPMTDLYQQMCIAPRHHEPDDVRVVGRLAMARQLLPLPWGTLRGHAGLQACLVDGIQYRCIPLVL